jgi:hypothetical protein
MIISNCEDKMGRLDYLKELSKYIPIDSYGKCFKDKHPGPEYKINVKDFPKELDGQPWYDVKWNITSQYKFVVGLENSEFVDYVSEKLFHAFIVNSIACRNCNYNYL